MNVLLLADASPSLRARSLVELGGTGESDPEVARLRAEIPSSPEVTAVLDALDHRSPRQLAYLLCRLSYLDYRGPEVASAAEALFDQQQQDGSWPLFPEDDERVTTDSSPGPSRRRRRAEPAVRPRSETWRMIPQQTSIPLRGLAAAGYAADPRAERGYEWLIAQRLDDGAWPGDIKADHSRSMGTPGYRKLPRSQGCRSATTGALAALALHPERRTSGFAHDALDHLLARETRDQWSLGHEVARLLGFERARGTLTFYATFDLAFLLDLASRSGVAPDEPRVADLVDFLDSKRGPYGLWEHPAHPQLSRWLSFDLDASLTRLQAGDWTGTGSTERVALRAYPKRRRRY
jgi:GNAT superfamily N-acetyltransferase